MALIFLCLTQVVSSSSDGKTHDPDQVPCSSGTFNCTNGDCYPYHFKCDRQLDCKDGSDEEGCDSICQTDHFLCDMEKCFPNRWKCNYFQDCFDNTDEKDCPTMPSSTDSVIESSASATDVMDASESMYTLPSTANGIPVDFNVTTVGPSVTTVDSNGTSDGSPGNNGTADGQVYLTAGEKAGIGVTVVLAVLGITGLIIWKYRQRKKKDQSRPAGDDDLETQTPLQIVISD
ncbi:low-density lipoprotein receptor-like isoform X2 [Ptychodera flava]|uniref:low-density lipoprotein receptor-like isoform X2 n=1 Tax=Ptychodera flava TaxID=63121 RepID=UPI00396AAC34